MITGWQHNPPLPNQEVYEILFLKDFFFSETRQAQFHTHAPTQMVWGWLEDEMPVQAKAEVLYLFQEGPHKAHTPHTLSLKTSDSCLSLSPVHVRPALPCSLCLLQSPLVSVAFGLFCTWQWGAWWRAGWGVGWGGVFTVIGWCGVSFQALDASSHFLAHTSHHLAQSHWEKWSRLYKTEIRETTVARLDTFCWTSSLP